MASELASEADSCEAVLYREVTVEVAAEEVDAFSDALLENGALAVSIEDKDANTPNENAIFGEPGMAQESAAWQHSRLVVLFNALQSPENIIQAARASLGLPPLQDFGIQTVPDQNWVQLTQMQSGPLHIGQKTWVVPSWTIQFEAPKDAIVDAVVIELDPGLAFGSGSHPTTQLCIAWLEQNISAEQTVLDYGCGSGILAILAAKYGATQVHGVDIDPQALEAARYNSQRNHVSVHYALPDSLDQNIAEGSSRPSAFFDVVVANILANPLKELAPVLLTYLKKGGQLVLSGILQEQAEAVISAYQPWLNLSIWQSLDGWVCLHGTK